MTAPNRLTQASRHWRSSHALCALLAIIGAAVLVAPGSASAATLTITSGSDPTESITTQLGVTGTADTTESLLDLKIKPTGGATCGANPGADGGTSVVSATKSTSGAYMFSSNWTFESAGSYLLCAWLRDYTGCCTYPVVASTNATISVRIPKLSLTLAAPPSIASGAIFQVSVTGQAETERTAFVGAVPDTGRGCAANWAALTSLAGYNAIDRVAITGGPTTDTKNVSISEPGAYLLCGYFQKAYDDATPEATAAGAITVTAPCIVPALAVDTTLPAWRAALATAHCDVGKVTYHASARVKRGNVISVNPRSGTVLGPMAAVVVVVSSGAPCIVPSVAGKTVRAARAALVKAHCTPGAVKHRRSHSYRKGRVVTTAAPRGARLSPRATVGIVVSSGRR